MKTHFFIFDQNNSGGYFDVDENVAHRVVVEADSEEKARQTFEPMIENQSGSCSCCGDRWSSYSPDEINLDSINKNGYTVSVYTHYSDYKERYQKLYGAFEHIENPKLVKEYSIQSYKGKVKFRSAEEYLQFLANAYGWTTQDVIIHYANGEKKQLYKAQ